MAAEQHPGGEHQSAAQHNLESRAEKGRFHIAALNPSDGPKFEKHHNKSRDIRSLDICDQIWQGMAQTADCCHHPGGQTAFERRSATRERTII